MEKENISKIETMDSDGFKQVNSLDDETENLPIIPLYYKSYCQTDYTASELDYTWYLKRFITLCRNITTIHSTEFPEAGRSRYKLEMRLFYPLYESFEFGDTEIKICIITEKPFLACYNVFLIDYSGKNVYSLKPNLGYRSYIENGSCLCETTLNTLYDNTNEGTLALNFTMMIFHDIVNETLHMKPVPLSSENERKCNNLISEEASLSSSYVIFKTKEQMPNKLLLKNDLSSPHVQTNEKT